MEEQIISLTLAGEPVRLKLRYGAAARFFEGFLEPGVSEDTPVISVSQAHLDACRGLYPEDMSRMLVEYNELPACISDHLLEAGCCIFHGAAFLWREKVYIFTGPSGTGKSTQYVLWKEQLGERMQILNGDKPILRLENDGCVRVWPSPWQGKEHMGSMLSGPLGGIILLQQGTQNVLTRLSAADAAVPLFAQFLFNAETEDAVHAVCRLESRMLEQAPVWRLVNRGDAASAQLCIQRILEFEEGRK